MDLKRLRRIVDAIDAGILKLLNKRAKVISDIGRIKAKSRRSVYVPHREAEVYDKLVSKNRGPLPNESVIAVFREIMSGSLALEKPTVIAYLGPEATFTHMAALKKFGSSVTYKSCDTITDVFSEVEKGRADYGVVPIENSWEGAISHTLDMLIDSDLKVCSEIFLDISHSLLSREADKSRIRRIYSKPEVFGQCRIWIESNMPKAELVDASSTTKAAEIASGQKGSACIASELAAGHYGLKVLESGIEDSAHNVTRFLVIGKTDAERTKNDKTSIMLSVKDKVGALHDILVPFKRYGINLTKIESRPSKVRAWEYYFFVDLEGHYSDPKVSRALDMLRKNSAHLKILGSYPAGNGA
ncbi:MAG: prephenate dehydratase [Candidatus Omnitrophota bacterium]